jgi:hypothetical protein
VARGCRRNGAGQGKESGAGRPRPADKDAYDIPDGGAKGCGCDPGGGGRDAGMYPGAICSAGFGGAGGGMLTSRRLRPLPLARA